MKKSIRPILCGLLALCLVLLSACGSNPSGETPTDPSGSENVTQGSGDAAGEGGAGSFTPGTYTVEVNGHNGAFSIDVTFDESSITAIDIGENDETGYIADRAFEAMTSEILGRQSLNVDTLSGATVTGAVVRAGVTEAVRQAGGDPSAMQEPKPAETVAYQNETTQMVVVGSGAAGLAATVQANELGLDVILVEQLGILGGSSVRAGYMVGGNSIVQQQQGIDYPVENWVEFMVRVRDSSDHGLYQEESARAMALEAGNNITWLYELGVEFGPVNLNWQHYGPNGTRIGPYAIQAFDNKLNERNIDYRLNTRATKVLMEDGQAVGIEVEAPDGSSYSIYADAVVLATGGFFANQEMVEKYDPEHARNFTDVSIGADGSGMLMAEEVGAVLAYMDQGNYHGLATHWNGASRSLTLPAGNGCIAVNAQGKRYANEAGAYELLAAGTMAQDEAFCIMDQTLMDLDVIQGDHGLSNIVAMYEVADTLEELAGKLGIDPEGLVQTVTDYQSYVENGEDLEFGKAPAFMRSDFSSGPYYGVKSMVENHTNHGGIVVDIENRSLDADGTPIPGLFAVGECAATHIQGTYTYQACIHNGRVVAQVIAADLEAA